jgi:nitrite reductase [NAD(P)H] small subunit
MWIEVCAVEACPPGSVRTVALDGLSIAAFRLADGAFRAIEDRCPHRGARLSRGVLYDGDKVACLDHGWSVRLTDGGVEPPETGCVRVFEVKVEEGVVFVLV